MRFLICLSALAGLATPSMAVTIVDFEDWTGGEGDQTSIESGGFNFTASPGRFFFIWNVNGDNRLVTQPLATVTMTKVGGGTFGIESLDIGASLILTGSFDSGGSISQILLFDGGGTRMKTFDVTGFTGLSSAAFELFDSPVIVIDNVIIPEPNMAPLLAPLAMLVRRKRR